MAGDWIKWTKGLVSRREVLAMSAALSRDRHEIAGRLMVLWEWCDSNIPEDSIDDDGNSVTVLSPSSGDNLVTIDTIAGMSGFASAMQSVGWLIVDGSSVVFPHLGRHNGKTAKERARNLKNQNALRGKAGRFSASDGQNLSPRDGDKTVTKRRKVSPRDGDKTVTREEKRRDIEENPLTPLQGGVVQIPSVLDVPEFADLWVEWKAERKRQRIKPYAPRFETAQLEELASWGLASAMEAIRASMRQGWRGLFRPKKSSERANGDERVMQQIMEGLQHP